MCTACRWRAIAQGVEANTPPPIGHPFYGQCDVGPIPHTDISLTLKPPPSLPLASGKCVPFDWVAFSAMLLVGRRPGVMAVGRQELWVGREDPSVLVLRDTGE